MIQHFVNHLATAVLIFFFGVIVQAQTTTTTKNKSPFPVKYISQIDQRIMLKTITLAPVYDNVSGIYAEPIQKLLIDLLQSDKVWGYSEYPEINTKIFIEKFDSQPNDVLDVLTKTNSQGLLTAFIAKGPRGINAKLKLFTQDQGLILIEDSFQDINTFEISKLREMFVQMYYNIKSRLPYRGYVLSRRGIDVTLNLGSMNGIKPGQELVLAQLLKLNRHPKLKLMIGAEKEIIAKLKVTKVEPYLSFAQIIFEKESGVVDLGAKVLPSEYVAYPVPKINAEGVVIGDTPADPKGFIPPTEAETTSKPAEELGAELKAQKSRLLDRENSFGVFTAQGLITQYTESTQLLSGANPSSSNSFAPGLSLGIQLYFKQRLFFVDFNTQISSFSATNSLAGSTPNQLSFTLTRYTALVGTDYLLDEDSSNKIKLSGAVGIVSSKTDVSTSIPTSLTSTQTDGIILQAKASMPWSAESGLNIGGKLDLYMSPKFSETPVSSGNANVNITSLGLFGIYPYSDKINIRADFGVSNISVSFSGAATRTNPSVSTSIQTLNEQIGIEYLF